MQAYAEETVLVTRAEEKSEAAKTTAPGAVASVVCGVIGLLVLGPIFGILAICRARAAKKRIESEPEVYSGIGLTMAGLTLGVIDLIGWAAAMMLMLGQ